MISEYPIEQDHETCTANDVRAGDWVLLEGSWQKVKHVELGRQWARGSLRCYGEPRPRGDGWERKTTVMIVADGQMYQFYAHCRLERWGHARAA